MKKYSLFIIFFAAIIALHACHKHAVTKYPVTADLKAAFNFKLGSYWIYKDSISGDIDSFIVDNYGDGYDQSNLGNGYSTESISIYMTEYSLSGTSVNVVKKWEYLYQDNLIDIFYPENKIYAHNIEYIPLINFPFTSVLTGSIGGEYAAYADTANVSSISATCIINGQTFVDVGVVNHFVYLNQDFNYPLSTAYSYNDWFYVCPNVGIIKMILNHPQDSLYRVWELQRWVIKK